MSNIKQRTQSLIKRFRAYQNRVVDGVTQRTLFRTNKIRDLFHHAPDYEKFETLIWVPETASDLVNLTPVLEFVKTRDQQQLWRQLHCVTSCLATYRPDGKPIRPPGPEQKVLVKDQKTQKYIGILSFHRDILRCQDRENAIGWTYEQRKKNLKHLFNLSTCVPMQPFGGLCNGGKLLASIAFSQEVIEYLRKKYETPIAAIVTTSLFGKSIQYSRLKVLKHIGFTKGTGTSTLPKQLVQEGFQLMKDTGHDMKLYSGKAGLAKVQDMFKFLLLKSNEFTHHSFKKGIYLGYTGSKGRDFLCDKVQEFKVDTKTLEETVAFWKQRWASKRFARLAVDPSYRRNSMFQRLTPSEHKQAYQQHYRLTHNAKNAQERYELKKSLRILGKFDGDNAPWHPAWLAGFIDGDGTVEIWNGKLGFTPCIRISQCHSGVLKLIRDGIEGGRISGGKRPKNANQRPIFQQLFPEFKVQPPVAVMYKFAAIRAFLTKIRPFTCVKSEQIDATLAFLDKKMTLQDCYKVLNREKHDAKLHTLPVLVAKKAKIVSVSELRDHVRSNNTAGITGVGFVRDSQKTVWYAKWDNKRILEIAKTPAKLFTFSLNRFGDDRARELAIRMRRDFIEPLDVLVHKREIDVKEAFNRMKEGCKRLKKSTARYHKVRKDNQLGIKGVKYNKARNAMVVMLSFDGKRQFTCDFNCHRFGRDPAIQLATELTGYITRKKQIFDAGEMTKDAFLADLKAKKEEIRAEAKADLKERAKK